MFLVNLFLHVALAFATSFATGQVWIFHNESSVLECQDLAAPINSRMVNILLSESLIGCAYHCTMSDRLKPVAISYDVKTKQCHCNSQMDGNTEGQQQQAIKYCNHKRSVKTDKTASQRQTRTTLWPHKKECASIYLYCLNMYNYLFGYWQELRKALSSKTGVYAVNPDGGEPINVWCDMGEEPQGITVIQRRHGGMENFNRNWSDYVEGFGDIDGEYWLGLNAIYRLTKIVTWRSGCTMKITLKPSNMKEDHGEWPSLTYMPVEFRNEDTNYELSYTHCIETNLSDLFFGQKRVQFSTPDRDNDGSERNLANETRSGWWFGRANEANPNMPYVELGSGNDSKTGGYISWPALYEGLNAFHVKIVSI